MGTSMNLSNYIQQDRFHVSHAHTSSYLQRWCCSLLLLLLLAAAAAAADDDDDDDSNIDESDGIWMQFCNMLELLFLILKLLLTVAAIG
jgi:hypothetical protein